LRRFVVLVVSVSFPLAGCWLVASLEERPVGAPDAGKEDVVIAADATGDATQDAFRCDGARADPRCRATTITTQQTTPRGIAVDGANVYWTTYAGSRVLQCPKAGCEAGGPVLVAKPPYASSPVTIAVDDSGVYWGDTDNLGLVQRRPDGSTQVLLSGQVAGMALSGDEIYCSRFDYRDAGYRSGIYRGPKGTTPTLLRAENRAMNVMVQGSYLYFGASQTGGAFGRCLLPACTQVDVYNPDLGINEFAMRGDRIYTTYGQGGGGVSWCQLENQGADCILRILAPSPEPYGVAVDDAHVYWASYGDGLIARCPIPTRDGPTCVPEIIASGQKPIGLALDDDYVYWTSSPTGDGGSIGSVVRAHK
jgi:hypothetical protein